MTTTVTENTQPTEETQLAKYEFNEGVPEFSQEDYLRYAQSKRMSFVRAMENAVQDAEGLATLDPDRQANYLKAIDSIEKQSLTLMKLKTEEQSVDIQNAAVAALILKSARTNNIGATQQNQMAMPDPELALPKKALIPGETEIGDRIENFHEYKVRTGRQENQDPVFPLASSPEE